MNESYCKYAYDWDISHYEIVPTKYATNINMRFCYMNRWFFLKTYISKAAFHTEKKTLENLQHTKIVPQIIDAFEGDDIYNPSIVLPFYDNYRPLSAEFVRENPNIAYLIGKQLRIIHTSNAEAKFYGNLDGSVCFNSWHQYLNHRLEKIFCKFGGSPMELVEDIYIKTVQRLDTLPIETVPSLIHGDLNPDNILFNEAENRLLFIDFERSYFGHYQMDFPKLLWRCFGFDDDLVSLFFSGYGISRSHFFLEIYTSIFYLDLLGYLISLEHPTNQDKVTINEILEIMKKLR